MENEKLLNDVKKIVEGIFSEKEQANQIKKTQETLSESASTISKLTEKLEEAKNELAEMQEVATNDIKEKDIKISELEAELEAAKLKVTETEKDLVSTKESLDKLNKEILVSSRMEELKANKVAIINNIEDQIAKIRDMSDAEFSSYKEDRIALRKAIEKELEDAAADANTNNSQSAANNNAKGDNVSNSPDGDTDTTGDVGASTTPPANITAGHAVSAAMNFEVNPSDSLVSKYAEFGKAMASLVTNDADK